MGLSRIDIAMADKTVTYPTGFKAAGAHIGLKKNGKSDLAILASENLCTAAGCFTQNIVKAAPVTWDMELLSRNKPVKAIVINSGNANACTGNKGHEDCETMAERTSWEFKCSKEEILVCSTGVIGVNLPMDIMKSGISETADLLGSDEEHGVACAEAIMTTDTYMKTAACEVTIGGKIVRFGGMAKGSGMIHPNMATMLGFVTTDCAITGELLQKALTECVDSTFNMITVDGDSSTNDTAIILANGMANNKIVDDEAGEDYRIFKFALRAITKKLAVDIARDGEGATKLMEVTVNGAKTYEDAKKIARSVTGSSLFKAALFGEDANWGRVLCAMGYSGGYFDPNGVNLSFRSYGNKWAEGVLLMKDGAPVKLDEKQAKIVLKEKEIFIDIQLNDGHASATAWGCDLTYDYVKINGDYRS